MNFSDYKRSYLTNCFSYGSGFNNSNPEYIKAIAYITGGPLARDIKGAVLFEDVPGGTQVSVEVSGLPLYQPATGTNPSIGPFGFHLHENGTCEVGNSEEPFTASGGHWNPTNQPHGNHAGDFPVLFSNNGYARMSFFTDKFKIDQIIDKAVIIHENPDDFRTQPSGDSGKRLACGIVQGMK
ncbi:Cu-Zn family superoxide dismutase [Sedimentibacter acidaminivorans]|jgi:superoxide dismutase, Cu-Zn family|uniref:Superoxide dismutase [Cu-Zn] n=1 Tax=Sedimentibacter acidaminivorans TaxID=913099 RepID=A0ABS4G9F7_9FIRM|nr:superoxide dismutase family protein [Sedimentibacter acidaminivorans]MBP1924314.1 Cu-Zn family superoxide dismutase [Sedimentibacter acidaminivorans]